MAEEEEGSRAGDFVQVAYEKDVAQVYLLGWVGEGWEDGVEESVAEVVFVVPDSGAGDYVFNDAVDDFVVESGEAGPVVFEMHGFGIAGESRGRFGDDEVVYVFGEGV